MTGIKSIWSLLLGVGLIGLAAGSQGSLLGIRASIEGFDNFQTGLVMSAYFFGFMVGSAKTLKIINHVGHVRTFAGLTAILSITILMHAILVDFSFWALLRFLSGLSVAGIWVVSESWLNQAASNEHRGGLLAIYMTVISAGMAAGQFLISISDPLSFIVFSAISVLVSMAGIPILLSAIKAPPIVEYQRISLWALVKLTPTGTVGIFIAGMTNAIVLGMGAVYATQLGMSVKQASYYIAAFVLGSMILQWPLGKLSDKLDRRVVTAFAALIAALVAFFSTHLTMQYYPLFLLSAFVFGGLNLTLYSLFNALANDFLEPGEVVSASGALLIINGLGATLGPLLVSLFMSLFGLQGFYWALFVLCFCMGTFCCYRVVFHYPPPVRTTTFLVSAAVPVANMSEERS